MKIEWWYWLLAGFILIGLELVIPSFTIIWFGLGALLVGILVVLLPSLPDWLQVLLWALASKARYRFGATTLGLFVVYGVLGMIASVALSPDIATSLYWGSAYLAPLFVIWFIIERPEPLPILRNVLRLNAAIVVGLLLAVLPEAVRFGFGRSTRFEIYRMPFGLGEVRANGVGRYAVLVLIIAGVSLVTSASKKRLLWLPIAVPSLFVLI